MNRSPAVGLCILCALAFSAIAAQSAAAAINGTTAYTCVPFGAFGSFSSAHCIFGTSGKWGHEIFFGSTGASTDNQNDAGEKVPTVLKATIAGIPTELEAKTITGSGTMENKLAASGEHVAHGTGTITYTEVSVKKPAANCNVYTDTAAKEKGEKGVVHTNELTATTEGQGMGLKFTPKEGNVFLTFIIDGCEGEGPKLLNKTYSLEGSVIGQPEGATVKFVHATTTAPETLLINGAIKAGINGSVTFKGESGAGLAATTKETP